MYGFFDNDFVIGPEGFMAFSGSLALIASLNMGLAAAIFDRKYKLLGYTFSLICIIGSGVSSYLGYEEAFERGLSISCKIS